MLQIFRLSLVKVATSMTMFVAGLVLIGFCSQLLIGNIINPWFDAAEKSYASIAVLTSL